MNEICKEEELKQSTISSREVAEMMEIRHDHLLRKINKLDDILAPKMGSAQYWKISAYVDASGKECKEYKVTKKGCELIAHKTTGEKGVLFTAKYMDRFEEMENMLKTGGVNNFNVAKEEIELFEATSRVLKLNENSKLLCVHNIYENNGLRHDYLPQYTESKDQLLSATELLKRNNVNISTVKFNRIMIENGMIEERERPSSKGGTKKFKALTNLEYGENQVSPKNPKETQILYYASKFNELCNRLGV